MEKIKKPYSKLRGRITEQGYSMSKFARAIDMNSQYFSLKLCGQRDWRLNEIYTIIDELDIPAGEITQYFPKGEFVGK